MSMTTGKVVRILVVGGKKHNVPTESLSSVCEVVHYEQDSREVKKGEISAHPDKIPHIVLCFNDFIGHESSGTFRNKAKLLDIPFVGASGGFGKLVAAAAQKGVDLSPFLKAARTPKPQAPKPKKPKMDVWIDTLPRQAAIQKGKDGIDLPVQRNKNGSYSLLMKGDILRYALERVKNGHYGKGTRGSLTPSEADDIITALDQKYGFLKRGINLSSASVIRNVGFVMGTLSETVMKKMTGKVKKASKKRASNKRPTQENKEREERKRQLAHEIATAEETEDGKDVTLSSETVKTFMRDTATVMKGMLNLTNKQDALYEKIVDLETQNATFIADAAASEERCKALEKELEAVKKEMAKWKRLATAD